MLHLLQFILYPIETVHALLEMVRKVSEQRRYFGVFEMLEFGDDVIALLARFHPVDKILQTIAAQPEVINAFRKHPGEEKRVVTNMLSHLAFTVERRRGAKDRVGFREHFADVGKRLFSGIADLEQLLRLAELTQQVGNIVDDLGIANADLFSIM